MDYSEKYQKISERQINHFREQLSRIIRQVKLI